MTGPSRREILRAGAALGLGAALPACGGRARPPIEGRIVDEEHRIAHRWRDGALNGAPGGTERARVLIVGGGVAGLSAAWRLRRAGFDDFALVELGDTCGGTARGGTLNGLAHPWGAHYLPVPRGEQRALCAFLEDAGLVQGYADDGRALVDRAHLVRAPQERLYALGAWDEGLWPSVGASEREREELARLERLLADANRPGLDGRRPFDLPVASSSVLERRLDQINGNYWAMGHALESEGARWYLEHATRDDYGARLEDTSAWALLHYFTARTIPGTAESGEFMTWPDGNRFLVDKLLGDVGERARTGRLATAVRAADDRVEVDVLDVASGALRTIVAEHAILALPQYVNARLLAEDPAREDRRSFHYGVWVVANLHLVEQPPSRGCPPAWDNVIRRSDALGYVDATHQLDRAERDTVWTWYWPIVDPDEARARREVLARTWAQWRDLVLDDLRYAHPGIDELVTRIDVWRWGHAMVKPVPGFVWGEERQRAARPLGRVHFAHSDLGGLPIFEEAHWAGTRAAEEVLAARGHDVESLLG